MKLLQVAIVASLIHVTLSQASCSQGETCSERNTSLPSSSMLQASYLQTADESVAESKANPIRKVINMLQATASKDSLAKDQCKDWCKFNHCPDKNNAKDCKTCCFCQADFWSKPVWKGKLGNKVTQQKYCDEEDPKAIAPSGDCSKVGYSIGHINLQTLDIRAKQLCKEIGGGDCKVRSDESVCEEIITSKPGSTPAPTDDDTTPNTPTPPGNGDACPVETIDHKCNMGLIGGCDTIVRGEGTKCSKECGKCVCKKDWKKKEASGITVVGLNPYWNLQYCMPPELPGKKYHACVSKKPVLCKESWKFFMRTFKEPTRFMSFSGKFWCKTDGGWGYLEGQTLDDDEQC